MNVEIVVHCYRYSRLLAYQLSSLCLHEPKNVQLTYTLYWTPEDRKTEKTFEFYKIFLPDHVKFEDRRQTLGELRNRAIGRNDAALRTQADWVWFADCDYVFADNLWEELAQEVADNPDIRFFAPLHIRETDWPTGDKLIEDMNVLGVRPSPRIELPEVKKPVAIGGLQIAHGPTVKEIGYAPKIAAKGAMDEWHFRSDISFRKHPSLQPQKVVRFNTLVRIRHTNKGYGQPNRHQVIN